MSQIDELKLTPNSVLVIGGPTASGKSGLALEAALRYNGVVINADAMQVYQNIPIITAAPTTQDKAAAPHLLYEIYPPSFRGNVADWLDLAVKNIKQALTSHQLPIVVGGTGLYIESLVKGISPIPPTQPATKQQVDDILKNLTWNDAYNYLSSIDASGATMIKPNDTTRLRRALEIKLDTGKSISEWFSLPLQQLLPEAEFQIIKLLPSLTELEQKCSLRFDTMIKLGALSEVEQLLKLNLDSTLPAMKAIGVPELSAYLKGQINLEEAISLAKLHTRQYAKRQLTWFRHH